jgi:hypothetical protein
MYYKHATDKEPSITIRHARDEDSAALKRLAQRDSSVLPCGELLVAAVGGELRAAVPVAGGETIADPFHPTAELIRLLSARAAQLRRANGTGPGSRVIDVLRRRRRGSATLSPQPAGTLRTFE